MGNLFTPFQITLKLLGKCDTKFLVPFLFLLAYAQLSSCQFGWNGNKPCAVLYSAENYEGLNFTLNDRDQSIDLAGDLRGPNSGWNVTESIVIERSCGLKVCNESYLDGDCQTLPSGTYPNPASVLVKFKDIASALCNCAKECKCSDIYMKRSSCARAYGKGGCSSCHSEYIELHGKQEYLDEDFTSKVEAFRIRRGCALTLYSEEEFEGEATVFDTEIVENYSGEFLSYECECDDEDFEPRVKPPRQSCSNPPLIDVPKKLDDVVKMLANKNFSTHPGLRAAHMSLKKGRSPKNAYILMLGSVGSGKSSAINLIFNNPQMYTEITHERSTTITEILEYRLAVPVDELGIGNSEIRVIEVPGVGDTRGFQQDAANLATLDSYLSNHEELHDRIPNVVLIFHKFHDNKFIGQRSFFVKMLQVLDSFRDRITDPNYSNVIFVFSHFGSETKLNRRRPDFKLNRFKSEIDNYSLFPRPIIMTVAENRPKENDFPMVDGYYKLPNNEYYPKNLFENMELVTKKGGDMVGLGIFNSTFREYADTDFNVTSVEEYNILKKSPKFDHYMEFLINAGIEFEGTEVSQILQQTWNDPEEINDSLKRRFPRSLVQLQKALHLRHVNTLNDVPRTTNEILKLLTSIKQDEATGQLLKKGLNIEGPMFPQSTIVGFGYDVFKDHHVSMSPFQMDNVKGSDIGFLIPSGLTCQLEQTSKQFFQLFDNREEYIQHRLQVLGVEWTIRNDNFKGTVKPSYNIKNVGLNLNGCLLTAIQEYRLLEFGLFNDELELSQEFVESVQKLPAFNQTDCETLEKWRTFFSDYGTHVVKSIHGGGAIQIQLQSDNPCNHDLAQVMFDLIQFAEDLSLPVVRAEEYLNNATVYGNITHSLTFKGGDHKYYTSDLTMMSLEKASRQLKNWKESLKFNPTLLTTELTLVPISQIVGELGQNYSNEIKRATAVLFKTEPISNTRNMNESTRIEIDLRQEIKEIQAELKRNEIEFDRRQRQLELTLQQRLTQQKLQAAFLEFEKRYKETRDQWLAEVAKRTAENRNKHG